MGISCVSDLYTTPQSAACAVSQRRVSVIVLQVLFCQIFLVSPAVTAQTSSTGAIVGVVLDISGRAIPEATVEVKGQDLAIIRSATCDAIGRFVSPLLPPGMYLVTAHKSGFSGTRAISVSVPVTETIRLAITMEVASITQR